MAPTERSSFSSSQPLRLRSKSFQLTPEGALSPRIFAPRGQLPGGGGTTKTPAIKLEGALELPMVWIAELSASASRRRVIGKGRFILAVIVHWMPQFPDVPVHRMLPAAGGKHGLGPLSRRPGSSHLLQTFVSSISAASTRSGDGRETLKPTAAIENIE